MMKKMKPLFLLGSAIVAILNFNCASAPHLTLQDLRWTIVKDSIEVLNVDSRDTISPPGYLELLELPEPVYTVTPAYPPKAIENKLEGIVWIRMWITENGNVRRGIVISSSNSILNPSALVAAIQWQFKPATLMNGKPVGVWVSIPFKFVL
jgi:TonB family protein